MKAVVNNVRVSGSEIIDFDIVNEDGLIGQFRLIEKDETKFGKYKLGQDLSLKLELFEVIFASAVDKVEEMPTPKPNKKK